MRPAGALIPQKSGYVLPIQGTHKGRYGECLALAYIQSLEKGFRFDEFEFFNYKRLCPEFIASHHFCYYANGSSEVFVMDGYGKQSDWEVRVFVNA